MPWINGNSIQTVKECGVGGALSPMEGSLAHPLKDTPTYPTVKTMRVATAGTVNTQSKPP